MAIEANWLFLAISGGLLIPLLAGIGVGFPQFLKTLQWHWTHLRITWCGKSSVVLQRRICEIRERIAKQFLYIMVIAHIFALVLIQLCIACSWPMWISEATGWTILLSSILLQSSLLFPRFLQRQITLDLWFLIVTILAASHLSPWHAATEEVLHTSLQFILVLFWRMPALVMCNRISFLFLCNVIFLCLVLLRERESTDSSLSISLWIELMIFVTTFAFGLAMQSVLTQWVQMNINGDDAKEQCLTIHTLLRFMCDAIVTMDDEGCLVHHSPNLAALLSLDENLEGSKLLDFMTEFEAERALGLLDAFYETEESAQHRLVNAFHTRLIDKYGDKITTEVLVVKLNSSAGEQYVVGLREFNDGVADQSEVLSYRDDEQSEATAVTGPRGKRNSMTSMLSSMAPSQYSEVGSAHSQVSLIPPTCRQSFLVIDVSNSKVCAASAGFQEAVGMMLQDLFPAPSTIQLLKRLEKDADSTRDKGEHLPLTLFSFSEMPVRIDGRGGVMSGTMQVLQHTSGSVHVLIAMKTRFSSSFSRPSTTSRRLSTLSKQSNRKKAIYVKDELADISTDWPQSL